MDKSSDLFGNEHSLDNQTGSDAFQFGDTSYSFGNDSDFSFNSPALDLGDTSKSEDIFAQIESEVKRGATSFSDLSSDLFGSTSQSNGFDFLNKKTESLFNHDSSPFADTSSDVSKTESTGHSDDFDFLNKNTDKSYV